VAAFGLVGDLLGNKAPINSTKLKKSLLIWLLMTVGQEKFQVEIKGVWSIWKIIVCNFK
jgi:hypothetical protein